MPYATTINELYKGQGLDAYLTDVKLCWYGMTPVNPVMDIDFNIVVDVHGDRYSIYELPADLEVDNLVLYQHVNLPSGLRVRHDLYIQGSESDPFNIELPQGLYVGGDLILSHVRTDFPEDSVFAGNVVAQDAIVASTPPGFRVAGKFTASASLDGIGPGLDVGVLDLSYCRNRVRFALEDVCFGEILLSEPNRDVLEDGRHFQTSVSAHGVEALRDGFTIRGHASLSANGRMSIGSDVFVGGNLTVTVAKGLVIGERLIVTGDFHIKTGVSRRRDTDPYEMRERTVCTLPDTLPSVMEIGGFLDISECAFAYIPEGVKVGGLVLRDPHQTFLSRYLSDCIPVRLIGVQGLTSVGAIRTVAKPRDKKSH